MGGDSKSLGLEPIARSPRNDLTGAKVELTGTVGHRSAVVVDVPEQMATVIALDLGPLPLDSPVVDRLEERPDLVLLLEPELGGVAHGGERQRSFVAGLEVEVRRVQIRRL